MQSRQLKVKNTKSLKIHNSCSFIIRVILLIVSIPTRVVEPEEFFSTPTPPIQKFPTPTPTLAI